MRRIVGISALFFSLVNHSFAIKYLIITPSQFYDAVVPLAEWKYQKGLSTKIAIVQVGLPASDIKDTIKKYEPEYVLLVGDKNFLPYGKYFPNWSLYYPSGRGTWTDQFYADTTTDNEYKDDIYLGRLPCSNWEQCQMMVNKIIAYEKGNLRNSNWYIRATGIARDQEFVLYDSCYKDAIRTFRNLLTNVGFIQVDTLFRSGGANAVAVQESVTKGRGFVFYRGSTHSNTDNWNTPFGVNPQVINNDSMSTVVISPTCRTMFFPETLPSYPEPATAAGNRWLRQGTANNPKGAVAFWGTTTHYYGPPGSFPNQQTFWRNAAGIKFFQTVVNDSEYILGKAISKAKDSALVCCSLTTFGYFGHATACSVAYLEWNLLGDPELNLWTQIPKILTVTYDTIIPTGPQTYSVIIQEQGNPLSNALVCLVKDTSIYQTKYSNSNGLVDFIINPIDTGQIIITVTKRNCKPFQEKVKIKLAHDVGISDIIQPKEIIDSTASIVPQVKVKNYGFNNETFNVKFAISEFWSDTKQVTNLMSNEERIVTFDTWDIGPRGLYNTKCSTDLISDFNTSNDVVIDSFFIRVRDYATKTITSPVSIIDSGAGITPKVWICNYGSNNEVKVPIKFQVLGTDYAKVESLSLNASDSVELYFPEFISNIPRGNYLVCCTTNLDGDCVLSNDVALDSFKIQVKDFSVGVITQPQSPIDSGTSIIPKAWVYNYGTSDEINVPVIFRIDTTIYSFTKYISLNAGDSMELIFDTFDLNLSRGRYSMKCSTQLSSDLVEINNCVHRQLTVITPCRDFAVGEIIAPRASIDSSTIITPKVLIQNFGNNNECDIPVILDIAQIGYCDTQYVSLNSGDFIEQEYKPFNVCYPRGTYLVRCTIQLDGDSYAQNNLAIDSFLIRVKDFAVKSISSPISPITTRTTIKPKAWIHNYGSTDESGVAVTFYISEMNYTNTKYINLNANDSSQLIFDSLIINTEGRYEMGCSTSLSNDINRDNNYFTTSLVVLGTGWTKIRDVPIKPTNKGIKEGGALTAYGDTLYALQGGNTSNFFAYLINQDTWITRCSIPYTIRANGQPNKKRVKAGAALVARGCTLYAFKGGNTTEFWQYLIDQDKWIQKAPIPESTPNATKPTRVKAGGSLASIGNLIYAFKGGNTDEFWVYNTIKDSWYQRKSLSYKIKNGGALVAQDLTIYALVGGNSDYFYSYIPNLDTWFLKRAVRFGTTKTFNRKIKTGAALTEKDGLIYAFKGGNTQDFGYYDINKDTWCTLETIPAGNNRKRVNNGGALVAQGYSIYALKGGNSQEFWRYVQSKNSKFKIQNSKLSIGDVEQSLNQVHSSLVFQGDRLLEVVPNPFTKQTTIKYTVNFAGKVTLKLYNVSGRLIQNVFDGFQNAGSYSLILTTKNLSQGVYFIKYQNNTYNTNLKIIVN